MYFHFILSFRYPLQATESSEIICCVVEIIDQAGGIGNCVFRVDASCPVIWSSPAVAAATMPERDSWSMDAMLHQSQD